MKTTALQKVTIWLFGARRPRKGWMDENGSVRINGRGEVVIEKIRLVQVGW